MNDLAKLLAEARRLDNLTVKDSRQVEIWRTAVDKVLKQYPEYDDPRERYDTYERVKHRDFIKSLFN